MTDEKLNEKLNEIGQVDDDDTTLVIVDKYIFQIDRTTLQIVDYLGEADGIIIKYKIIGNDNWIKREDANITVNVTIQDNGGTLRGDTIKIVQDETDITSTVSNVTTGEFTLTTNTSTTYVISAKNSKDEKLKSKTIEVKAKIDETAPIVDSISAIAKGRKIKLSTTGTDIESGIKQFNYTINPQEGIKEEESSGTFKPNEEIEIQSTTFTTYTITITAIDNVDNVSESKTEKVETRHNNSRGKNTN